MSTLDLTAQQAYAMLGNSSVWDVARRCEESLNAAALPHALVGGMAVCLHGYQRNTIDVDMLIRREDRDAVRAAMEQAGFTWDAEACEFRSSENVPVQFLISGDPAGASATSVRFPDPSQRGVATAIEGLSVISLPRLIELKLACGLGNLRRTHRDLADVVELIARHNLGRDFARYLHKSLRGEYRKLVLQARGQA